MKFTRVAFMVLLSFSLLFLVVGCSDDDDDDNKPAEITDPVITYNLSGRVVDGNSLGIGDAKVVYVVDGQSKETTTDASGKYRFTNVGEGAYTIKASKSGYTFGSKKAIVDENGASVDDITLKSLVTVEGRAEETADAEEIKKSGAEVKSETSVNLSTGGQATEQKTKTATATISPDTDIVIDDQVVSGSVSLAVTPMQVNEVPPADVENELSMGAVVFEPQNAKFSKPVQVKVPVEIQLPPGLEIPLKKYENGEWKEVGTAKIDESGLGADADVTEFGQLSVQPEVNVAVDEGEEEEDVESETEIEVVESQVEATTENSVEFPEGLPEGITQEYALSLIQKLEGFTVGESKALLDMPELTQKIAKPASPLAAASTEYWVLKYKLVKKIKYVNKTVTLTITVPEGHAIEYNVTFRLKKVYDVVEVERVWIDHDQGSVD